MEIYFLFFVQIFLSFDITFSKIRIKEFSWRIVPTVTDLQTISNRYESKSSQTVVQCGNLINDSSWVKLFCFKNGLCQFSDFEIRPSLNHSNDDSSIDGKCYSNISPNSKI